MTYNSEAFSKRILENLGIREGLGRVMSDQLFQGIENSRDSLKAGKTIVVNIEAESLGFELPIRPSDVDSPSEDKDQLALQDEFVEKTFQDAYFAALSSPRNSKSPLSNKPLFTTLKTDSFKGPGSHIVTNSSSNFFRKSHRRTHSAPAELQAVQSTIKADFRL